MATKAVRYTEADDKEEDEGQQQHHRSDDDLDLEVLPPHVCAQLLA